MTVEPCECVLPQELRPRAAQKGLEKLLTRTLLLGFAKLSKLYQANFVRFLGSQIRAVGFI